MVTSRDFGLASIFGRKLPISGLETNSEPNLAVFIDSGLVVCPGDRESHPVAWRLSIINRASLHIERRSEKYSAHYSIQYSQNAGDEG